MTLSRIPALPLMLLLLLASALHAAHAAPLTTSGTGSTLGGSITTAGATYPQALPQGPGTGFYWTFLVSTGNSYVFQTGNAPFPSGSPLAGVPAAVETTGFTTSGDPSACMYVLNAAGLAALSAANVTNTCPSLPGIANATLSSGAVWTVGGAATRTFINTTQAYAFTLTPPSIVNQSNPLVYGVNQFLPAVSVASQAGLYYRVYVAFVLTTNMPAGTAVNATMLVSLSSSGSPSPPAPPSPPTPPSPNAAGLLASPASGLWMAAVAFLAFQLLIKG